MHICTSELIWVRWSRYWSTLLSYLKIKFVNLQKSQTETTWSFKYLTFSITFKSERGKGDPNQGLENQTRKHVRWHHRISLSIENHTSPRESKADIRNSIAPIRLWKRGTISSSLLTAVSIDVYVVTLRTFWKSESVSSERPSSAFAMIWQMQHGNCQRTTISLNIYYFNL